MLQMNRIVRLAKAVAFLCAFAAGFVIAKFLNVPFFSISEKVDVVAALQILSTFAAAFLVAKVLDKQKQDDRIEKDLLLKRIEDVYIRVEQNCAQVLDGKIEYVEAAAQIKRIRSTIDRIVKLLNSRKINIGNECVNEVISHIKALRDLLTKTPIIPEGEIAKTDLPIQVKNGIIHLSKSQLIQIESKYEKLKDSLLALQLAINKA